MRFAVLIGLAVLASVSYGQTWMSTYEDALAKARKAEWSAARDAFKAAAAFRTEDQARATTLPGPATEKRTWRNGAPYSPNFLAAYAGFKASMAHGESEERANGLRAAAAELEMLLSKSQNSAETFFLLNSIYSTLGDTGARIRLDERIAQVAGKLTWKVDTEPMTPEDISAVNQMMSGVIEQPGVNPGDIGTAPIVTPSNPTLPSTIGGRVPTIPTKFALLIGNSESKMAEAGLSYGADDAQFVREGLLANAGYAESNVDLVLNATAENMKAAVNALAERVPEGATVFVFFTGVGANLGGKDYLAGVDTASPTDSSTMFAKSDLYAPFMAKGARIFAFYQVSRPVANGRYFGMEVPLIGSIAQCQATIPGESVQGFMRGGKVRGLYSDSLVGALSEIRANRIPIQEFGWQVFYRMRRGDTGIAGGGSRQTPTLPVLTNMGSDARF